MEDIAENESNVLAEMPIDDPDYGPELRFAIENLSGKWDVFKGTHMSRPAGAPLASC